MDQTTSNLFDLAAKQKPHQKMVGKNDRQF